MPVMETNISLLNKLNDSIIQLAAALVKIFNVNNMLFRISNKSWHLYMKEINFQEFSKCSNVLQLFGNSLSTLSILHLIVSLAYSLYVRHSIFFNAIAYFGLKSNIVYYLKLVINMPIMISSSIITFYYIVKFQMILISFSLVICKSPVLCTLILFLFPMAVIFLFCVIVNIMQRVVYFSMFRYGDIDNKPIILVMFITFYYIVIDEILNIIINYTNNSSIIEVIIGINLTIILITNIFSILCYLKMQTREFFAILHYHRHLEH
ncbi:hypothetical protein NEPAR04_2022 [Nematocida parisii]|nr:hypothetical protein NEPAR03_2056 [Nematocida parisii]KAI5130529.1 hypothetical protein NEPAR08_2069 [Nematocida parisii]KAI5143995.1 hypothetical protein NEPAR04_2022 [Nematocida parisii]